MRKKVTLCLILAVSTILYNTSVYAMESSEREPMIEITHSVLDTNDKEVQRLGVLADEQAIKVYNIALVEAFARSDNVQDIITKWSNFAPEYYVVSEGLLDRIIFTNWEEKIENVKKINEVDPYRIVRYELAIKEILDNNAMRLVASDIKIKQSYYFNGETTPGDGIAIYYETTLGNFVYYTRALNEYVFPLGKFVEVMKKVDENRGPDTPVGTSVDFADFSKYDIHSADFDISANGGMTRVSAEDSSQKQQLWQGKEEEDLPIQHHPQRVLWCLAGVGTLSLGAVGVLMFFRQRRRARS